MAEKPVSVRLQVIDGGKVKAEFNALGAEGQRALDRIKRSAEGASPALRAVDAAAGGIRGELEGMTHRLGPAFGALRALGPAGLVAGAGIAAAAAVVIASVREFEKSEAPYRRLQAVLAATGGAAGITARDFKAFAESLEDDSGVAAGAVLEASAALSTFAGVGGEELKRALRLTNDFVAVFGGDLPNAAENFGRALADPVSGLTAFRKVLTESQRDAIKAIAESEGLVAGQIALLDALEEKIGGAAASQNKGVTGAANQLKDAWSDLLKVIGGTPAIQQSAEKSLSGLEGFLRRLAKDVSTLTGQSALEEQLERQRRFVARIEATIAAGGTGFNQKGLAAARAELTKIQSEFDAEEAVRSAERVAAAEAEAAATAEAERAFKTQLEKEDLERIARLGAANAKIIDDLKRKRLEVEDPRQGFIEDQVARLNEAAGARQREEAAALAGAAFDAKAAAEAAEEAEKKKARALSDGEAVIRRYGAAEEQRALKLGELKELLDANAISQETYNRAVAEGSQKAFQDYLDDATDAARQAEEATTRALRNMEDALVAFARTGKLNFRDFADSVIADLVRIAVQQEIIGPLAKVLGLVGGAAGAGAPNLALAGFTVHAGGVPGKDNLPSRFVPAAALIGAPRFHEGRAPGTRAGEIVAIIRDDEGVFTPAQMKALGGRGTTLVQNFNFNGVDRTEVAHLLEATGRAAAQGAIEFMDRRIFNSGV